MKYSIIIYYGYLFAYLINIEEKLFSDRRCGI